MLPWLADHVEETVDALGRDYWTYGIESNLNVLETFLGYHHAQGLSPRRYAAAELFAPSTSSSFVI
jgi:4,5-dihydroxyphthalate decarboxylase